MDIDLTKLSTETLKQEIKRREDNARKCYQKFFYSHGDSLAQNSFFRLIVSVCFVAGTLISYIGLLEFFMHNYWTNLFTGAVFTLVLGVCGVCWLIKNRTNTHH
jgi:hypothetical protein